MKSILVSLFLISTTQTILSQSCTALWSFDDTADLTIQFFDNSTSDANDPIVSWDWDFDDGTTSTQQNPLHTFPDPDDKYDVVLTITTQNGCTSELEIRIEICGFTVSYSAGACDSAGNIPYDFFISDIHDNADEVDIILDGQSIPGSPFEIDAANPLDLIIDVPGDGLSHTIQIQSTDIPTCFTLFDFTVPDCNSNCFLSGLNIEYTPSGVTHTVDVGDNFFAPSSVALDLGDEVEFIWVGDGHSTTSDATSGPDAWNSGVISAGSSFVVNIQEPGVHPYYCIPHGGPGGAGMSGELLSNCPGGSSISMDVSFNTTVADPAGFDILWDGAAVPGSPFPYSGTGPQLVTIDIAGDGNTHTLEIVDVNDPTCTLSTNYDAPDCNQGGGNPVCSMTVTTGTIGACNASNEVPVDVEVDVSNGGSGFFLSVDGGTSQFFNYSGNPTIVTVNVPGDGLSHTIDVEDDLDPGCNDNINITTPDCTLPCAISNVVATPPSSNGSPSGIFHQVEVQDFQFSPAVISITSGDQIEWIWTGAIDHTSTSDATSGPDSWDSGLQGNGTTFLSPVLSQGVHDYYCIPHGAPGGVGMAGSIDVLPPCNANNEVPVVVTFDVVGGGASGYNVIVDGTSQGPFSYAGGTNQSVTVDVAGDNASHTITIQDIDDAACNGSTSVITPDCSGGGGGGPMCSLTMTASVNGACNANGDVPVELVIIPSNAGTSFTVNVDGTFAGNFNYEVSGTTTVIIDVVGDGLSHTIEIVDDTDPTCTATANVTTTDCTLPCAISNVVATPPSSNGTPSGIFHQVEVQDFQFSPAVISITSGDQIEWIWTGAIDHTSTSDATSGPDSWDSGLQGNGTTFLSPVLSQGVHDYYCIPHGAPGGVGMAGSIDVLPPCNANNEVPVVVTFDVVGGGASGYNVIVDGTSQGPFSYTGGTNQSVTVDVAGDNASHTIIIQDIDDAACNGTTSVITPDCSGGGGGGPMCSLTMTASVNGACNANGDVPVELVIIPSNAGTSFTVNVDGAFAGNFNYEVSGTTTVIIDVVGDGLSHTIEIVDDTDPSCTATANVTTPDCTLPCSISNLVATPPSSNGTPSGIFHEVEVQDFQFSPAIISITSGDQIEWVWTGAVDHTATSDATSGADSWDSGLLSSGATYLSPVLSEGNHPYYCIPHGAPGGVGMAGIIDVLPPCNANDEVAVTVSFDVAGGGASGYNVLVDGVIAGTFSYTGNPSETVSVDVSGDNSAHTIQVQDIDDAACSATTTVVTPDCSGGGGGGLICSLTLNASLTGTCDANGNVETELTVIPSNAGTSFDVFIDGVFSGNFDYEPSGSTIVNIDIAGDGQTHTIEIVDDTDSSCTATSDITTPDCNLPCSITNLTATPPTNDGTPSGVLHQVEVKDFEFDPAIVNITAGDQIEWVWTGAIPHTATSDDSSGPDSWDSGLLGQGETYTSPVLSEGTHPYYCIPHGAPGGIGMAGVIDVLPPCNTSDQVPVTISFDVTGGGASGYNVLVDGNLYNTFSYSPATQQNATVFVAGDNSTHTITVVDIEDNVCTAATQVNTPDCSGGGGGGLQCSLSATLNSISSCDSMEMVTAQFSIQASNAGSEFDIIVDNILINTVPYSDNGTTEVDVPIVGDGSMHTINFIDGDDSSCSFSFQITSPSCGMDCTISNATINFNANTTHFVEVEDFEFVPKDLSIVQGDTIQFVWTGIIPHTVTSDATTGTDVFDSQLLVQGDTFELILNNDGLHPYYCIPHGAPGGIGMAGTINVQSSCENGLATGIVSFDYIGANSGAYNLFLDSLLLTGSPFSAEQSTTQMISVQVPGDSLLHELIIIDQLDSTCFQILSFNSPLCSDTSCLVQVSNLEIGDCNNNSVNVSFEFSSSLALTDFQVVKSGAILQEFSTDTSGVALVQLELSGTGFTDSLLIRAKNDNDCNIAFEITLPDCLGPCLISDFLVNAGPATHIVEVKDFVFDPIELNALLGDTIKFIWTGNIPHTVTSDATNGPDVFDSGLLGQGAEYNLVINQAGDHPYYCIPHGGPGGIGMAGSINVLDTCGVNVFYANTSFTVTAGSPLGYNLFIDGTLMTTQPFTYENPIGENSVTLELPLQPDAYNLTIQDVETPFCAFTTQVTPARCDTICTFENIDVKVGSEIIHIVEVRDFDFSPKEINVNVGETIRFVWTGDIPHTATSDKISGADSWDSGLLGNGATYDLIITTPGLHPYYCIPHGGPGGIGMAGTINALPACNGDLEEVVVDFTSSNGSSNGFNIFLNGTLLNAVPINYDDPDGANTIQLSIPADGQTKILTLQDVDTDFCAVSQTFTSSNCLLDSCVISGLSFEVSAGNSYSVEVRDFDFEPKSIDINLGDTLNFIWTGVIPHTVTSDAVSGNSVFNSGLLGEGAEYQLILSEPGFHPYYCIPHGGPGGIGMAGEVFVTNPCDDDIIDFDFEFYSQTTGSYNVYINDNFVFNKNYNSGSIQNFGLSLEGDGSDYTISVIDNNDDSCMAEILIPNLNCETLCFSADAAFQHNINSTTLSVQFSDQSMGDIVSWTWDFGDGGSSQQENPTHIYTQSGVYDVCLTVVDADGCEDSYCDIINLGSIQCDISFDYEIDGLEVTFFNTSNVSVEDIEIVWDFDDGFAALNVDSTSHEFEVGVYEVCLLISGEGCSDLSCQTIDLTDVCLPFSAAFSYTSGNAPNSLQFVDLSDDSANQWLWGFGDGSTSTEQNPVHEYAQDGIYNVCLLVQDTLNNCSASYCESVAAGTVSVNDLEHQLYNLKVIPNPSPKEIGFVTLENIPQTLVGTNARVSIFSTDGRKVNSRILTLSNGMKVDAPSEQGLFYVVINTKNATLVSLFIVV